MIEDTSSRLVFLFFSLQHISTSSSIEVTLRCLYPFYDLHKFPVVDPSFHSFSYLIPHIIIWLGDHIMRLVNTAHTSLYYTATPTISASFLVPSSLHLAIPSSNCKCGCNSNPGGYLTTSFEKGTLYRFRDAKPDIRAIIWSCCNHCITRPCTRLPVTKRSNFGKSETRQVIQPTLRSPRRMLMVASTVHYLTLPVCDADRSSPHPGQYRARRPRRWPTLMKTNPMRTRRGFRVWPCLESFITDLRVGRVPPPGLKVYSRVLELGVELAFLVEKPLLFRYFGHQHNLVH